MKPQCDEASAVVSLTIPADKTLPEDRATKYPIKLMDKSKGIKICIGRLTMLFHALLSLPMYSLLGRLKLKVSAWLRSSKWGRRRREMSAMRLADALNSE